MINRKLNLIGFSIWNNNNSRTSGKTAIDYSLGKMRNTSGSTTRIHKHCSRYSSDPLNCTFRTINSSNQLSNVLPPNILPDPPANLNISGPPTILSASIGNGETVITFTAGLNLGPSITDYLYSIDGTNYVSSGSTSSPIIITGLTNGVTYNITLKAVNVNGNSITSNSVSVTPSNSGPLAPVITGISFKTTDSFVLTFTQASNGITITNYKYSLDNGNTYTALSPVDITSPITISGLTSNTTYNIKICATSASGDGAESDVWTESTYANVNYVTFTDVGSSTWTAPEGVTFVQYLVVGGGGGGGATYSKINVLGNVLVTGTPQAGAYWINNVHLTSGRYSGRMYYSYNSGQNSASFTDPIRVTASETIASSINAIYPYNKWYGGIELVYINTGLATTTNYFGSINNSQSNNISGGSGGGAGGQVKTLTGTNKYTVIPGTTYTIVVGSGGQGGQGGTNTETNGSPGGDSSFDIITSIGGSGGGSSRNTTQLQDTNKFGKGGNGGQGDGNLVGGSGGGQNNSNNYGLFNSGGAGSLGSLTNFYGSYQYYGPGGNGGVPNTVATGTTLANVGKGGSGTGAILNSYADGIDGGSGIVVIRYYT